MAGDVAGGYTGSFFTLARTGQGTYTVTVPKFYKITKAIASYLAATPAITNFVCLGVPVKSAVAGATLNTWTIPFIVSVGGATADLPVGDKISFDFELSNTKVVP